jgi:hypothetical protein
MVVSVAWRSVYSSVSNSSKNTRVGERTSRKEGKRRSPKELTGHPAIGVRQLGTDGLCLHLGYSERGLGGLKTFLESQ